VVQPAFEIGGRAAEILLDRIESAAADDSVTVRLHAMLKVGQSSRRV
jgi:DNA-binding LacI/PurR family transcriptional regulator